MSRGKQAAAAANRRADEAEKKIEELKERLRVERQERASEAQSLKDEIAALRNGLVQEAARLAQEEITRLNEKIIEMTAEVAMVGEIQRTAARARDHLMYNMCRYLSMTKGRYPAEAACVVVTWLTGEQFDQKSDTEKIAVTLDLPDDGWIMKELRRAQNHMVADSVQGFQAVTLDHAEKHPEDFDVHPAYKAEWYMKRKPPVVSRRTMAKGVYVTSKNIVRVARKEVVDE